jgi:hypothetical protein
MARPTANGFGVVGPTRATVDTTAPTPHLGAEASLRRLGEAEAAVRGLTPPGPGRRRFTAGWELERAVAAVLAEHEVAGLLEVSWERQETARTKYIGRGRGGPNRPKTTEWDIRYQVTTVRRDEEAIGHRVERLGWQVLVRDVPAERLSLEESLWAYRGSWCGERLFHLLKDRPLGIRPFYVRRDDQILGLTHLVTLALRVLMLFEVLVRRGQERSDEKLPGLYPGQAKRGIRSAEPSLAWMLSCSRCRGPWLRENHYVAFRRLADQRAQHHRGAGRLSCRSASARVQDAARRRALWYNEGCPRRAGPLSIGRIGRRETHR